MRRVRSMVAGAALLATMTGAPAVDAATGRCPQWEATLVAGAPRGGWDVRRMSAIAWRESRCQPDAVNRRGGDSGLLQIHPVSWPWLSKSLGVTVNRTWLLNPVNNVAAAARLCEFWRRAGRSCYQPWAVR